jgi:hypothetical protein
MSNKTRKKLKYTHICKKNAKKGALFKCRLKTCTAKKYQSVYGKYSK